MPFLTGLFTGAMVVALGLAHARAETTVENLLFNGDFEAGTDGWTAAGSNVAFVVDDAEPVASGVLAARLHLGGAGEAILQSQYWHTAVEAHATYRAAVQLHGDGLPLESVEVRLRLIDDDGGVLAVNAAASPAAGGVEPFTRYETGEVVAPPDAAYARLTIRVPEGSADVVLSIDDASLVLIEGPPPPPPPDPVGSPPPTATPTASPTPAATPTATPTVTSTPTPTPTPTIAPFLRNASFEEGADGWEVTRGEGTAGAVLPGFGLSLVLRAGGTSTMWAQQAVTVSPGGWYNAGAILAPGDGVSAGWVRIAWYATPDASGSQMATVDSPVIGGAVGGGFGPIEFVETGPVQAPLNALSARVRILLRPAVPGATMAVDDVVFHPTSPPPPPTPTPTPTATPTAIPSPTTTPASSAPAAPVSTPPTSPVEPAAPAGSQPGVARPAAAATAPGATFSAEQIAAVAAGQAWVRVTELLPNAVQPGIDADYEWVEITNIGPASVSLHGMQLEDNRDGLDVLAVVLAPGASLVIAAPLADVGSAAVVQRVPIIGNGLSNTGDRLALFAADGTLVDALSYGSDDTYAPAERISAPRPGHSIVRVFASDGRLVEVRHAETPSPGFAEILDAAELAAAPAAGAGEAPGSSGGEDPGTTAESAQPRTASPGRTMEQSMWLTLLAGAGAAVAALAVHRVATTVRAHRAAGRAARGDEGWAPLPRGEEQVTATAREEAPPLWVVPPTNRGGASRAGASTERRRA